MLERCDVVVVGAGFAGLYMLYRLRAMGLTARAFEAGSDVGGTWYWNRYPGARCDVESMQYSFSFDESLQQEWKWSERFASQPEIVRYAGHVADRFDLRRDIRFDTRVTAATFDEAARRWTVETDRGDNVTARFCVMATGCLSAGRRPDIPGIDDFKGSTYHTGEWPLEGVDFSGRRVGVIGTGSSAIQAIPMIAEQAERLVVFQRTPNFSLPARNTALTPDYEASWKQRYAERREEARHTRSGTIYDFGNVSALSVAPEVREQEYTARWHKGGANFMMAYNDIATNAAANATAADFVRARIADIVRDPTTAAKLTPRDYPIGTKRICVDTGYFETFNRPSVELVDVRTSPMIVITARGVRTSDAEHKLDSIVFATGFDAITGALSRIAISGRGGASLRDKWTAGPRTYLGLMTAGFPNLFMVTGPGSPSVLSNMIVSIEQHVDWIADCLGWLRDRGVDGMEADVTAEDQWVDHVNEVADTTLYPQANSWYLGANVPGKPRVFMPYVGGVGAYRRRCSEVAQCGYAGFRLTPGADERAA
jgi:cyclohexanone monooxygenase